jgi:hypothetical protein
VKWYLKREGLLEMSSSPVLDYYLVLTGPASAAASSRESIRPWSVDAVHLFDAHRLYDDQPARGVKKGAASSVLRSQWDAAEIYPRDDPRFPLTAAQGGDAGAAAGLTEEVRTAGKYRNVSGFRCTSGYLQAR